MYFTLLYVAAEMMATFATVKSAIKLKNRIAAVPDGTGIFRMPPLRFEHLQTPIGIAASPPRKKAGKMRNTMMP
jgi:hypothetical protein